MGMTEKQRARITADAAGKTVQSLTWEDDSEDARGYWVMVFTDGSEISFRLMAEEFQLTAAERARR